MPDGATTKFKVDISELKANIQEANRQIRLANAEFKAASSGMDNWAESADGVSAKIKSLEKVLEGENKKLDSLEEQLKLTAKQYGENSKEADEMRIKVANQQAVVNKTTKEVEKFRSKLKDLESAQESCADSAEEQADAMEDVGDSAKKQETALKSLDDATKKVSDGFTIMKGAIANLVAEGFKSLVSGIGNAVESSREYRTEMSKLDSAFSDSDVSASQAKDTYKDFYSILGDSGQSVEAVNFLSELAHNQKDLNKWTTIATGVYGKFGASLPVEALMESSNETAKVGQITGNLADALNWAGVSEDEFNEKLAACSTEQERQNLIMNTLNGLYSESAKTFQESNKEVIANNKATQDLAETQAELGKKVEPIMTSVKQGFADLLGEILNLTNGVDYEGFKQKIDGAFKTVKEDILPAVVDGLKWIKDNSEVIIAGIVGIGTAFAVWKVVSLITGVINAYKAFKIAQEGATVAQWLLNIAMNANPIGILITLIAALVAAFIYLWNNCDSFRQFFVDMWENIKKVVGTVVDAIAGFFKSAWETIKNIWGGITDFFKGLWDGIKNVFSNVGNWFKEKFEAAKENAQNAWKNTKNFFGDIWKGIKNVFSDVGSFFKEKFEKGKDNAQNAWKNTKNFFSDTWSGIKNVFSNVGGFFKDSFNAGVENIKNAFGKVPGFFKKVWQGIKDIFSGVGDWFGNIFEGVKNAIKAPINWIIRGLNSLIGGINKIQFDVPDWVPFIGGKKFGFNIGKIPELAEGAVVRKGKQYLLEGAGDEAVVPLHNNKKWISKTARDLKNSLQEEGVLSAGKYAPATVNNNYTFNQTNTSPKPLSRLEIYRQTKNQLNFAKGV